jgi:hypothetical protein
MPICTLYHVQQEQVWKYEREDMIFNNKYVGDAYCLSLTIGNEKKKELHGAGIKRQTYNYVIIQ